MIVAVLLTYLIPVTLVIVGVWLLLCCFDVYYDYELICFMVYLGLLVRLLESIGYCSLVVIVCFSCWFICGCYCWW